MCAVPAQAERPIKTQRLRTLPDGPRVLPGASLASPRGSSMRGPRIQGPTRVTLAPTVCTIETEGFGMNVPFVMGGILFPSNSGPRYLAAGSLQILVKRKSYRGGATLEPV